MLAPLLIGATAAAIALIAQFTIQFAVGTTAVEDQLRSWYPVYGGSSAATVGGTELDRSELRSDSRRVSIHDRPGRRPIHDGGACGRSSDASIRDRQPRSPLAAVGGSDPRLRPGRDALEAIVGGRSGCAGNSVPSGSSCPTRGRHRHHRRHHVSDAAPGHERNARSVPSPIHRRTVGVFGISDRDLVNGASNTCEHGSLLGLGPGLYQTLAPDQAVYYAHNVGLDALVELGYLGGVIFIAFVIRLMAIMWQRSRELVFPVLVAVVVANMFDDALYLPRNGFLIAALVGLAGGAVRTRETGPEARAGRGRGPARGSASRSRARLRPRRRRPGGLLARSAGLMSRHGAADTPIDATFGDTPARCALSRNRLCFNGRNGSRALCRDATWARRSRRRIAAFGRLAPVRLPQP